MKKVFVGIFAVIGIIAVIGAIVGIFVIHALIDGKQPNTGVIQKDGGDVLFIASNASGQGGTFYRFLKNDGVMSSDIQEYTAVGSAEFIPLKSGRCVIAAETYFATNLENERVFDVTVDENLKINYVYKYIYQFALYDDISFENCLMTVQKGESSAVLRKETEAEIGRELSVIYGSETAGYINAPDLLQP